MGEKTCFIPLIFGLLEVRGRIPWFGGRKSKRERRSKEISGLKKANRKDLKGNTTLNHNIKEVDTPERSVSL